MNRSLGEFHHIGVACTDLDAEERIWNALGYAPERPDVIDERQGVRARFVVGGGPRIELLRNLEGSKALDEWLRRGMKAYHTAYEVDDLEAAGEHLAGLGGRETVAPMPAIGFGMRSVSFWLLPNLLLIELISRT